MRLMTWNVNGIRAVMKKGFEDIVAMLDPDVVCIQEIKAMPEQIEINEDLYPYTFINSAKRKGYSGTMIMTRFKPISASYGMEAFLEDEEGRIITLEYEDFYIVTVYTPNSKPELARIEYRMLWDEAFGKYIESLNEKKPVLLCGDLNAASADIDVYDAEASRGQAGYSVSEVESLHRWLLSTLTDTFRYQYPEAEGKYTWWPYYQVGRSKNQGWRIDYWLVSNRIMDKVNDTEILDDVFGSDHCPVMLDIDLDAEEED